MSFTVIFNLILTVLTVFTGIVWAVDRFVLSPKRMAAAAAPKPAAPPVLGDGP